MTLLACFFVLLAAIYGVNDAPPIRWKYKNRVLGFLWGGK